MELNGYKVAVEFIAEFNHFSKEPYFCLSVNGDTIIQEGTHLTGYMSDIKEIDKEHHFFLDVDGLDDSYILPQSLGMSKRQMWSNNQITLRHTHNEVGEDFYQIYTKYPYKVNQRFKIFLSTALYELRVYSPVEHISLSTLHEWFMNGEITEEEADRRIQYFYVYDSDDHRLPETLYKRDWAGNIIDMTENRFSECRDAVDWKCTMNYGYISRRPYEVYLEILKF